MLLDNQIKHVFIELPVETFWYGLEGIACLALTPVVAAHFLAYFIQLELSYRRMLLLDVTRMSHRI